MLCSGATAWPIKNTPRTCCHQNGWHLSSKARRQPKRQKLFAAQDDKQREPSGESAESTESLFMKELRRRGYQDNNTSSSSSADGARRGPSTSTSAPDRPPSMREQPAGKGPPSQLDLSRQLNSEGLEGLPARASLLLRLGGSFFLGFVPFILVVGLLFGGIYLFEGSRFIHGGRPNRMPDYINPDILLAEPGPDPRIPYD